MLIPVWVITAAAAHGDVSWSESSVAATRVWLMGFGGTWVVDGVALTLAPLGTPALAALMLVPLARLFGSASPVTGIAAIAAFSGTVTVAHMLTAAQGGADDLGPVAAWSAAVATPAVAWGLVRKHGLALPWVARIPVTLRTAARGAIAMVLAVVGIAALGLLVGAIAGRHTIAAAAGSMSMDVPGGIAFAAVETVYAPTLVAWMVAWGSGAGFTWAGVQASSVHPLVATLPPVPILGALPQASGGILAFTPVLMVLAGAAVTVALRSRLSATFASVGAAVGAAAGAGVMLGLVAAVARGAAGPGDLASVGPDAAMTGVLCGAWLAVGAVLAAGLRALVAARPTEAPPQDAPQSERSDPAHTEPEPAW